MIKIAYIPYSEDLSHPADRRRIKSWADYFDQNLIIGEIDSADILVLSNASNFEYWIDRSEIPIVLDLVDSYLGDQVLNFRDLGRNILRSIKKKSSLKWIFYSRHLKFAISNAHAVVVASHEQKSILEKFNSNIYVIPDNFIEFENLSQNIDLQQNTFPPGNHDNFIVWEGFAENLKHFKPVAAEFERFLLETGWGLHIITSESFAQWGGFVRRLETMNYLKDIFPNSHHLIKLVPWSIDNLIHSVRQSRFAVIPIDHRDLFAFYKPENKLISFLKLGKPALISTTPAYIRVADSAGLQSLLVSEGGWYKSLMKLSESVTGDGWTIPSAQKFLDGNYSNQSIVNKWNLMFAETLR